MFFLTVSNIWSFFYFFLLTYTLFISTFIIYLLPITISYKKYYGTVNKAQFTYIKYNIIFYIYLAFSINFIIINLLWVNTVTAAWFGHLIINNFSLKISYIIVFMYLIIVYVFCSNVYFSSKEIYDYLIVIFNFFYWLIFLFFANSIFTAIFVIEVISTLIFLLIITSTFSTAYFYKNNNLSYGHLFQQTLPYSFLQSLLFFFWVSLVSSLNLFVFLMLLYFKLFTFDWYLIEVLFNYYIQSQNFKNIITLGLSWFIIVFCIFLKCGVAPLFLWKPTFFKGIPFPTLFIYICFFYFFFFIFILNFFSLYFNSLFYFFSLITFIFILCGILVLFFIICESFYIKIFLAISSILNSLLVLLGLLSSSVIDIIFFI